MNKPKQWLEITIACPSEAFEAIENFCFESGSCGLEEEPGGIKAYFPDVDLQAQLTTQFRIFLKNLNEMGITVGKTSTRIIPNEDWSHAWRVYFKPVRIPPNFIIKPPWEKWKAVSGELVIDITPQMAFGTGTHETTQICLTLISDYSLSNATVLDIGTGSGILAIAAAKLGASKVLGIEINDTAVSNARKNILQNRVRSRIDIVCGSLDCLLPAEWDFILVNINRNVLKKLIPRIPLHLNSGGLLVLSGLLKEEEDKVRKVLENNRFIVERRLCKGEWIGLAVKKKELTAKNEMYKEININEK
jgi:ribosomal protein L11 methyltransferase